MRPAQMNQLLRLHAIIIRGNTGTSEDIASLLGVTCRTVAEMLSILRDMGAMVEYNRKAYTYHYGEPFVLEASYSLTYGNPAEELNTVKYV